METKSRTQYSAYNTTVGLISRFMAIIMGYVVRRKIMWVSTDFLLIF